MTSSWVVCCVFNSIENSIAHGIARRGPRLIVAVFVVLLSVVANARGQGSCTYNWRPVGPVPGVSGYVFATTSWDPDGGGPQVPLLVVAGGFGSAGGISVNNIAAWDGSKWSPMGSGFNSAVTALFVHDGMLIAGGSFSHSGSQTVNYLAKWNGTSWEPIGQGVNGAVSCLTSCNGELVAGGAFTSASGTPANRIAKWNGVNWQALGSGMDSSVYALATYNGELIAGGNFSIAGGVLANRVARWNGTTWSDLTGGKLNAVLSLAVFNGELIVGGDFSGGGVNYIARWDGKDWRTLGTGMNGTVNCLTIFDGGLIAGGSFTFAGGSSATRVARWNGTTWQPVGNSGTNGQVYSLCVYEAQLIAGGLFSDTDGYTVSNIARWDGTYWQAFGGRFNSRVRALSIFNGELIAGGDFTTSGGARTNGFGRWDGWRWERLGTGLNGAVNALAIFNGDLVVAGSFQSAGGSSANNIAKWNGSSWQALGNGLNGSVYALAVYNGALYAAGSFTSSGVLSANRVARWNGTTWQAVGTGLDSNAYALAVFNNQLYVGGEFLFAGGVVANNIARWNGTAWHAVGSAVGTSSTVDSLTVHNGKLIMGGTFTQAGGISANHIGAWDGASWTSLNNTFSVSTFTALGTYNGSLIACGLQNQVPIISNYDGSNWTFPFGSIPTADTGHRVHSIGSFNGELILGAYLPNYYHWARWGPSGAAPTITQQPVSQAAPLGETVGFGVAASGAGTLSYRWRKDDVDLFDGGSVSGATTPTLTINPIAANSAGRYDCIVKLDGCGLVVSNDAVFTIGPRDSDGDGIPDATDNCPLIANPTQSNADGDSAGDACDGCPSDPNKTMPGFCGCGLPEGDTDMDGTPDCTDGCPSDPNKTVPGLCGCGVADTDTDSDSTPDCQDDCPLDPLKTAPGVCGCGIPDTDTDNDGTPDCEDGCPMDPNKIAPGQCGCGLPDTDDDGDGTANCDDGCPNDPNKIAPGQCGCGNPDVDTDNDGTADCIDGCPNDPNAITPTSCGCGLDPRYSCSILCPPSIVTGPAILGFAHEGGTRDDNCAGSLPFKLYAGRTDVAGFGKVWRILTNCTQQQFGASMSRPESVLIDTHNVWPSACSTPNLIIVGGRDTIGGSYVYFVKPDSGTICEQFVDGSLGHIGQMVLLGNGDLLLGSVDGDSVSRLSGGILTAFYTAAGQSLRALCIDESNISYVTGANDGIMRKIAGDGTVLDANFATGLAGAISQAIAPPGIFHGNLFVACGAPTNRVMEVDITTGATSEFLTDLPVHGIAFDPDGFMHLSVPSANHVVKIGPGILGDMDGSGARELSDLEGFVKALLRTPDAPLPILAADMTADGCADGQDIQLFLQMVLP